MSWGLVAGAAITVIGGAIANDQANDAASKGLNAQERMTQAEIAEQRRQYDQSRTDMLPWLQAGQGALADMQALNSGDFSKFFASPDYQFTFSENQRAIDSGAAARGGLLGGGHTRDTMKFGQGLASQEYNNFYNKKQSMAGQGQTTAGGLGALGANMAGQIGNAYGNLGNARQSAYNQIGQNNAQFAAGTAGSLNKLFQNYNTYGWGGV